MKKVSWKPSLLALAALLGLVSCSKEEFSVVKKEDGYKTSGIQTSSASVCAGSTLVRPPVNFLFLWDNSSSQVFVNAQSKQALANTIQLISNRFDYRILMAPLILNSGQTLNSGAYLVTNSTVGLNSTALAMVAPQEQAASKLSSFATSVGSAETGMKRTVDLLSGNVSNGIFRPNAYTVVVIMSNGDDLKLAANGQVDTVATNNNVTAQFDALINVKNTKLTSPSYPQFSDTPAQVRVISLVSFTSCISGYRQNYAYKRFSEKVYGATTPPATDQNGREWPDSYDICGANFSHLFDGINDSIQDVVLKHQYDAWPISSNSAQTFDPDSIRVTKSTGEEVQEVAGPGNGDGFHYIGYQTNKNTRYAPTAGEPYTGHMIELYGNARVTYPECLIVKTDTPAEYYGYVHLNTKPVPSTIKLTINGKSIPQSTTDGWEYLPDFRPSQNIKVTGPNSDTPATPALNKSGYFLRVRGSAVYTNGATVQVVYDPSGT